MSHDREGLGRLLSRQATNVDVPIRWDVRKPRRYVGRKREESESARVLDISPEGALIEVPTPSDKVVGDHVVIAFENDGQGVVEIRHRRPALSGDRTLYGVLFIVAGTMTPTIRALVDDLSDRPDWMLEAWNTAR